MNSNNKRIRYVTFMFTFKAKSEAKSFAFLSIFSMVEYSEAEEEEFLDSSCCCWKEGFIFSILELILVDMMPAEGYQVPCAAR